MTNWLISISGARPEILSQCPTERVKFSSLGWAILIASVTGAISMWLALTDIVGVNGLVAVPVAVAWGFAILGLERWSATSAFGSGASRLAQVVPRLLLTLLVAVIVVVPLVLRVYQAEINAEIPVLQERQLAVYLRDMQQSPIGAQVSDLRAQVYRLDTIVARGSGKPGYAEALSQLHIVSKQLQLAEVRENLLVTQFTSANASNHSVVVRLQALSQAETGDGTLTVSVFLLATLLVVIEVLPITLRQIQRPGNYELILQETQRRELLDARRYSLGAPSAFPPLPYATRPAPEPDLYDIWTAASAGRQTAYGNRSSTRDATEPEMEPAESFAHSRHEDAALAMLDDTRTDDRPTSPEGISLTWDDGEEDIR